MCDNKLCRKHCGYTGLRVKPFDGQFVHKTWPERTTYSDLQRMYEEGKINATWWRIECHARFDVHRRSAEQLRHHLGIYLLASRQKSSALDPRRR